MEKMPFYKIFLVFRDDCPYPPWRSSSFTRACTQRHTVKTLSSLAWWPAADAQPVSVQRFVSVLEHMIIKHDIWGLVDDQSRSRVVVRGHR